MEDAKRMAERHPKGVEQEAKRRRTDPTAGTVLIDTSDGDDGLFGDDGAAFWMAAAAAASSIEGTAAVIECADTAAIKNGDALEGKDGTYRVATVGNSARTMSQSNVASHPPTMSRVPSPPPAVALTSLPSTSGLHRQQQGPAFGSHASRAPPNVFCATAPHASAPHGAGSDTAPNAESGGREQMTRACAPPPALGFPGVPRSAPSVAAAVTGSGRSGPAPPPRVGFGPGVGVSSPSPVSPQRLGGAVTIRPSSESAASSSGPRREARPGHDQPFPDVRCQCVDESGEKRKVISGICGNGGKNHGARYYKCVNNKPPTGCGFWHWHSDGPPARNAQAPEYREEMGHDRFYALGGRVSERVVVLCRRSAPSASASTADTAVTATTAPMAPAAAEQECGAWVDAVFDRWNITEPVATDPVESDADGAMRLMPLIDLDEPMGRTAKETRHPHVGRTVVCTALFAHMAALRGWRVVVQPPATAFYQHMHLSIAQGTYDSTLYWVRIEPAQRLNLALPNNAPVQFDAIWVPLTSHASDSVGWLTGSHVDIVVYEVADHFILMDRRNLWRYIDRHVVSVAYTRALSANASRSLPSVSSLSSSSSVPSPSLASEPMVCGGSSEPPRQATSAQLREVMREGRWIGPTVSDPMQADHRVLDMGAIGHSPHERRTFISVHNIRQHDDAAREAGRIDDMVIREMWKMDPAVASPYLERMGGVGRRFDNLGLA